MGLSDCLAAGGAPCGGRGGGPYLSALARLASLRRFGVRLGLERIRRVLEILGQPQQSYASVHIAGTNGKGSTAAMIAACLRSAGVRTGLFTSPHLHRFSERITVNGQEIPPDRLAALVSRVLALDPELTFFEVATAVAMQHFAEVGVGCGVFETGLGGRLDATNVLLPRVVILTSIDLDHTEILGGSLAAVAREKAGIIKPGVVVVAAPAAAAVAAVIEDRCQQLGAPLRWVVAERAWSTDPSAPGCLAYDGSRWKIDGVEIRLRGQHQRLNAALCVAAIEQLTGGATAGLVDDRAAGAVREGLREVRWPGRMETVHDPCTRGDRDGRFLLDCAHNPAGAASLAAALAEPAASAAASGPYCLVFGHLEDKASRALLAPLLPLCGRVILTRIANPRSVDPRRLASLLEPWIRDVGPDGLTVAVADSASAALRLAREHPGPKLVAGSIYLVAELRALLLGEAFDPLSLGDPLERVEPPAAGR